MNAVRSTMRRATVLLCAMLLALVAAQPASARTVVDSAGRSVEVPDNITRVFAAGPPASTLLYVLAPDKMIGWVRSPRAAEKPFLLPATRELPALGRLSGRADTLNIERLLAEKADLIIDFGTLNDTYKSLADRMQAQTGIPYLLIDGRFANTPAAIRLLADILGVSERGEQLARAAENTFAEVDRVLARVPADKRPKVYLARGTEGLETGSRGSINTEIIERVGAVNVVEGLRQKGGIANASLEQVMSWQPDAIVTLDKQFASTVAQKPEWAMVPAVAQKRVFLSPSLPFGFIDGPPSLNRLVGLSWLLYVFYPEHVTGLLNDKVRDFYRLFYHVELSDSDLVTILDSNGR